MLCVRWRSVSLEPRVRVRHRAACSATVVPFAWAARVGKAPFRFATPPPFLYRDSASSILLQPDMEHIKLRWS
jgi:hypothetical protein